MRKLILLFVTACSLAAAGAQTRISETDFATLETAEKSLKLYARNMIFDPNPHIRLEQDSLFTRSFVRALRTSHSFYYPFDSVITVSKLYAPDSSFRIFTWQYQKDEGNFRQRGAIQMRTDDGSLKLYPLFDVSEFTDKPTDSVRGPQNWIGAIYYNIVKKTHQNKDYYTLFGYDDYSYLATRKWLDILTFDEAGRPRFGERRFAYKPDTLKPAQPAYRFLLEYKKDARARLVYDPEMDMIVFDHLVSENNDPSKHFTLVPDGDYEGFKWEDGRWVHVNKVFNQVVDMSKVDPLLGNAPREQSILDAAGNVDEKKLMEQSLKNMEKAEKEKAEKEKPKAPEKPKQEPVKKKKGN